MSSIGLNFIHNRMSCVNYVKFIIYQSQKHVYVTSSLVVFFLEALTASTGLNFLETSYQAKQCMQLPVIHWKHLRLVRFTHWSKIHSISAAKHFIANITYWFAPDETRNALINFVIAPHLVYCTALALKSLRHQNAFFIKSRLDQMESPTRQNRCYIIR